MNVPDDHDTVALLDLDGTLSPRESTWQALGEAFGVTQDEFQDVYDSYVDEELTHAEMMDELYLKLTGDGPVTEGAYDDFVDRHLELHVAAYDLVDELQEQGVYTAVLSGAPDDYSEAAREELDADANVETISLEFKEGALDGFDWTDYRDKEKVVDQLQQDGYEVWAVGNGGNDVDMVESAGRGFMLLNTEEVAYDTLDCTTVDDLTDVLEVIQDG